MPATGWIPNVVTDTPIESAWGNSIRDRTVTPFLNAAQRDAEIAVPLEGMSAWLMDTNRLTVHDGTGWRNYGDHRGVLAIAEQTAATGAMTSTAVQFLGLTPVTFPANRWVRVSYYCYAFTGSTSGTVLNVQIRANGVAVQEGRATCAGTLAEASHLFVQRTYVPAAGSTTYTAWGQGFIGTAIINADANRPGQFILEDLGPSA